MRMLRSFRTGAPRLRVLLAALSAMVFLQACAQNAAESTDDPSIAAEESDSAAGTSSEAPTGEGSEASDEGDAQAGAGDQVASIDLDGDFCTIRDRLDQSGILTAPLKTPEEAAASAEQVEQVYGAMNDKAPRKIADDMRLVSDAASQQMNLMLDAARSEGVEDMNTLREDPELVESRFSRTARSRRPSGAWRSG
jgi:hypothetical protein